MSEISNKTLAILIVIAMLISIVGLFVGRGGITTAGKAAEQTSQSGALTISVSPDVAIFVEGTITIPDVAIGETKNSEDASVTDKYIRVAAQGKTPVRISYYADETDPLFDNQLDGTPQTNPPTSDSSFQLHIVSGGTLVGGTNPGTITDCAYPQKSYGGSYEPVVWGTANRVLLVNDCSSDPGAADIREGFQAGIEVTVPQREKANVAKTTTLYFYAQEYT